MTTTAASDAARVPPPAVPSPPPAAAPGGDEVALTVEGPLDAVGAERLRAVLDDAVAAGRRVVLDVSTVDHVSAAALAVLTGAHARLRDGGGALVLASPHAAVVRVLRISGLHRVLLIEQRPSAGLPGQAGTTTSTRPVSTS